MWKQLYHFKIYIYMQVNVTFQPWCKEPFLKGEEPIKRRIKFYTCYKKNIYYSLCSKLLECFKKNQCSKLGGWFSNWPNKEFFWKSNGIDGKRHYQLA